MPEDIDRRGGLFAIMPPRLIFDPHISQTAKTVYAALACYADENRECYPRQAPIAHRLELSQGRISQCLSELVRAGYIAVERFQAEGQPRATNHYRLLMDQPAGQANISRANVGNISPTNISRANVKNRSIGIETEPDLEPHISAAPAARESVSKETPEETRLESPSRAYALMHTHKLWIAFASFLPAPQTRMEEGKWAKAIRALDDIGATPEEIRKRVIQFKTKWPRAAITPLGIANTWSQLDKGGSPYANGYDPTYQRVVEQSRADRDREEEEIRRQAIALARERGDLPPNNLARTAGPSSARSAG